MILFITDSDKDTRNTLHLSSEPRCKVKDNWIYRQYLKTMILHRRRGDIHHWFHYFSARLLRACLSWRNFIFASSYLDAAKTTILKIGKPNYRFLKTASGCHSKRSSWTSQASSKFLDWSFSGSKLWQIFHIDLTHSSYTANPLTVRRYFWRGWRGEFG